MYCAKLIPQQSAHYEFKRRRLSLALPVFERRISHIHSKHLLGVCAAAAKMLLLIPTRAEQSSSRCFARQPPVYIIKFLFIPNSPLAQYVYSKYILMSPGAFCVCWLRVTMAVKPSIFARHNWYCHETFIFSTSLCSPSSRRLLLPAFILSGSRRQFVSAYCLCYSYF